MKISTNHSEIEVGGNIVSKEFSVKVGSALMEILSGLYSNPVDAIVREYLTNMYDAYVALRRINPGAPIIPPELHIPTILEPYLEFKDYGVGMSKNTLLKVYSEYNNSTKNDNDEEVGGFGLGAKAAFCYNEGQSWSVESRFNGTLFNCMAFIDDKGKYQFAVVSNCKTTEHNGVSVQIPILTKDFISVKEALLKYLPFFPMEVTLTGDVINYPKYDDIVIKHNNTTVFNLSKFEDKYKKDVIIMGNVPYPIDWSSIPFQNKSNNPLYKTFEGGSYYRKYFLHIEAPIGSVHIIPSRDGLKYTPTTIKYISDCMNKLNNYIQSGDCFKLESSEYDAATSFMKLCKIFNLTNAYKNGKANYKNNNIRDGINRHLNDIHSNIGTFVTYGIDERSDSSLKIIPQEKDNILFSINSELYTTFIYLNDEGNSGLAKIIHDAGKQIYRITDSGNRARSDHIRSRVFIFDTATNPLVVSNYLGNWPISSIKVAHDIVDSGKPPSLPKQASVFIYNWSRGTWRERVHLPSDNLIKYYLILTPHQSNGKYFYQYNNLTNLISLYDTYSSDNISSYTIYGVRETEIDKIKNLPNWVNFQEFFENKLIQYYQKYDISNHIRSTIEWGSMKNLIKMISLHKLNDYNNIFKKLDVYITKYKLNSYFTGSSDKFIGTDFIKNDVNKTIITNIQKNIQNTINEIQNICNEITNRYSLLPIISNCSHNSDTKISEHLKKYIDTIDADIIVT